MLKSLTAGQKERRETRSTIREKSIQQTPSQPEKTHPQSEKTNQEPEATLPPVKVPQSEEQEPTAVPPAVTITPTSPRDMTREEERAARIAILQAKKRARANALAAAKASAEAQQSEQTNK